MRNLVMDKLVGAQMVVFNRLEKGEDTMPLHKIARAANRRIDILYDYTDGTTEFDDVEDPLPFDINAPVIMINDEDYALFYQDITEEPKKYDKKTVRFKGQVAKLRREKSGMFAPGRFVMTCVACLYSWIKSKISNWSSGNVCFILPIRRWKSRLSPCLPDSERNARRNSSSSRWFPLACC